MNENSLFFISMVVSMEADSVDFTDKVSLSVGIQLFSFSLSTLFQKYADDL